MITLVGVGHVFRLEQVLHRLVVGFQPSLVAIELDGNRLEVLKERARAPAQTDLQMEGPLMFRVLAHFQEQIAGSYGSEVGAEMLAAAAAAQQVGAGIACIDRDVREVVDDISAQITWREQVRFFWSLAVAFVRRDGDVEEELQRFQADDVGYLDQFAAEFPTLKRILIDERNAHMIDALDRLDRTHDHTMAIVGDGHVPGILAALQLQGHAVQAIRLSALRDGSALQRLPSVVRLAVPTGAGRTPPPPWEGEPPAMGIPTVTGVEVGPSAEIRFGQDATDERQA